MDKIADKNLVKKVMTFKSGNFAFSRNYDHAVVDKLVIEAKVMHRAVAELPILPAMAASLEEETIRRSIFSTAALEGNPLNEEQVANVLHKKDKARAIERADQEIENLKVAYSACKKFEKLDSPLRVSEKLIKTLHEHITQDIEHETNRPGIYRDHVVKVGNKDHGGVYTPPKIKADIEKLMQEMVAWLNSPDVMDEDFLVRAGLAHYHLAAIHPFSDGNGRTARLVEAAMLRAQGVKYVPEMLSNYYYKHMDDYYWAFSLSERNKKKEITPFLEFVLHAFIASLYDLNEEISENIRLLALRDYVHWLKGEKIISTRQRDLLNLLLEHTGSFAMADLQTKAPYEVLYRAVSERTLRRDLARLLELRLLLKDQEGAYYLNTRALDNQ